jgi:hypothetical protein
MHGQRQETDTHSIKFIWSATNANECDRRTAAIPGQRGGVRGVGAAAHAHARIGGGRLVQRARSTGWRGRGSIAHAAANFGDRRGRLRREVLDQLEADAATRADDDGDERTGGRHVLIGDDDLKNVPLSRFHDFHYSTARHLGYRNHVQMSPPCRRRQHRQHPRLVGRTAWAAG